MNDAEGLARIAERAADAAAAYLRRVTPPDPAAWQAKGHQDFVTEVDRTAEALIVESLHRALPDSRVIGEEGSPDLEAAPGVSWIVDPLDGTTNFLHRYPVWAVSIGAAVDGDLVAGTIFDVPGMRRASAWRGGGAWSGGRRLRVSTIPEPSRALVATGFPFKAPDSLPGYLRQLERVLRTTSGVRRAGAAALDLLAVADGQCDGYWELVLAPWDTAAGIVLVREAGGVVTRLDGTAIGVEHGGVIAGNPAIHAWLLGVLDAAG